MKDAKIDQRGAIIAFRAPAELVVGIEAAAASEGISRSDVARRACLRDMAQWASLSGKRFAMRDKPLHD